MGETLIDRIKRHEGLRLHPYFDTEGNVTIGYGHNLSALGIDETQAEMMLSSDIRESIAWHQTLSNRIRQNCNQARREVLIEMIFQMGIAGVLQFRKMLNAIENGDFDKAAEEMLDSKWHKQTIKRCEELAEIMRLGK